VRKVSKPVCEAPKIKVFRPEHGRTYTITILGTDVHWYVQHWSGSCCVACQRRQNGDYCEGCEKTWPERTKGYLDCGRQDSRERCLLEMTPTACDRLWECVGGINCLRGSVVEVGRGKGQKTTLTFALKPTPPGLHLPPEINPDEHVERLLGLQPRIRGGGKRPNVSSENASMAPPKGGA